MPHSKICFISLAFHFSLLYSPVTNQHIPRKSVAQIQRTNTKSKEGSPVCVEKKPIEPKILIETIIFTIGPAFIFPPHFQKTIIIQT